MVRLSRLGEATTRFVASVAVVIIVCAALMTVGDVFMRSIVNRPLFGTNDIVLLMFTVAVSGCFPYANSIRHHMRVDSMGRMFGPRFYWALEVFAALATLLAFAGFAVAFAFRAERLGMTHEGTQLLLIPLKPFWLAAALLMALAAVAQIVIVVESAVALARGTAPPGDEPDGVI